MCVFLNLSGNRKEAWSTEGCSVVSSRTNSTTTTCACDHMTLFAVLMEASSDTVNRPAIAEPCYLFFQYLVTKAIQTDQSQRKHKQRVSSAGKRTSVKRGKTQNEFQARENTQRVPSAGKHSVGGLCGKTNNGCLARGNIQRVSITGKHTS